jgi:hypothetical protein
MTEIFLVKRLLDRMDKIGPNYGTIAQTAHVAALDLLLFPTHPVVDLAKEYARHELECMKDGLKPMPLGQWYYSGRRRRRRQ